MNYKAVVDAGAFSDALAQVSKVRMKASASLPPLLSEVMVRFSGGRCILTATDFHTWLIKECPAQGDDFSFVFQRTKDLVKASHYFRGDMTVELHDTGETQDRRLELCICCGGRTGQFEAYASDDYPTYTAPEAEVTYSINAAKLLKRVERVCYAAPKPDANTRPSTQGVQFVGHHVFALDGQRLACDTDSDFEFPKPFMANGASLSHLKLFGDQEVKITHWKSRIQITDESTILDLHMPCSDFYHLASAIPKTANESFMVSPSDFLRELKYLKQFVSKERHPYVRFSGSELVMPAAAGKYRTNVAVTGEHSITFAFDLHKMIDAMLQFKDEPAVQVKVNSPVAPIVISAERRSDFALICPVRLTERLLAA